MKKFKTLLLLTMCLAMVVTTITIPSDNNILLPNDHYIDELPKR